MNKKILKQRGNIYGNSFTPLAKKWEAYLKEKKMGVVESLRLTPQDTAIMLAILKEVRRDHILKNLRDDDQEQLNALDDTIIDMKNYYHIAENIEDFTK